MSKTASAPSATAVLVSTKTPVLVATKKVVKIRKQKPGHGTKRYNEAERNVILGKKKAGVSFAALKKEYGVTPKTIRKWLKKTKAPVVTPKVKVEKGVALRPTKVATGTHERADVVMLLTQEVKRQEAYLTKLKSALAALTG